MSGSKLVAISGETWAKGISEGTSPSNLDRYGVGHYQETPFPKWVKIDAVVDTYKPGSVVYLAVTSQPVIFGAAVVSMNGQADFSGFLPIDSLSGGGHSIRIVGLRELSGVTTDQNGEVVLTEETLSEI